MWYIKRGGLKKPSLFLCAVFLIPENNKRREKEKMSLGKD